MDDETLWIIGSQKEHFDLPVSVNWALSEKDLPQEGCFAIALVLNDYKKSLKLIAKLRQQKAYCLTPIFYIGKIDEPNADIFDGSLEKTSLTIAKEINQRIQLLPSEQLLENEELLLLSYLFTRPNTIIHCHLTSHSAKGINFPLLHTLIHNSNSFDEWSFLQNLVSRDLLEQEKLIDEIHTCPHCYSGLLNYKNSCPNCHSIDIKTQQFIHCFSCGNISPFSEFLRQERLICSRCSANLRHIGIDYDKPLEDKLCNQCGFYFLDAEVNIICMSCSRITAPENLVSRKLHNYKLTKRGEFLARGIEKKLQTQISDFFEFIDFDIFLTVIKWQTKLAIRYKTFHFSILALKIINEDDILNEFGIFHAEKLLIEFYDRLRQVFRDSDLASRGEGFVLFFYL